MNVQRRKMFNHDQLKDIMSGNLDSNTCDYINPNYLLELADLLEAYDRASVEEIDNIRDFAIEMFER